MKKLIVFALALVMILSLTACGGEEESEEAQRGTPLGSSALSIIIPEGYVLTDDEFAEDQVAYYYKDDASIDFDVYQWEKGDQYTLETEAEYFAAQYNTTAEAVTVNDINGMKYVSTEDYEGSTYTVVNYMFEDDTYIVELCFWTEGTEEDYADVEAIINTLAIN